MKRICFVTAIPMTVEAFLIDYIRALSGNYDITVATNTEDTGFLKGYGLNCKVVSIPIKRDISPLKDLFALFKLFLFFHTERFHSVHSVTPKAGLLAMGASFLARIPVRIHTFTGQVWATNKGIIKCFLKNMDRIIASCATHIFTDSPSQREFIIKERVVSPKKVGIIGHGSISGVDSTKFSFNEKARDEIRDRLGIGRGDFVFLFMGRLNRDKGILDLIEAFLSVVRKYNKIHLLVVGPDEEGIRDRIIKSKNPDAGRIHFIGLTKEPEKFMSASDCLCLPSYREGFGLVIIEAASVGIPAIGSRVYGITDAIEEGVTGLLHTPGNVEGLAMHMEWMIENKDKRTIMGQQAKKRAHKLFSKERMVEDFKDFYMKVVGE